MVQLVFLDIHVFNVLKFVILSLTVSCAADILLETFYALHAARQLLKGRCVRPESLARLRVRRGINLRRAFGGVHLFGIVVVASGLEIALELSADAETIWMEQTGTFRMSKNLLDVNEIHQYSSVYISSMRKALQRVEGSCFDIADGWYSPTILNLTSSIEFQAWGRAAWCLRNYTTPLDAMEDLQQSGFRAVDVEATGLWNSSELRFGRDEVDASEIYVPFSEASDVRIGVHEYYSNLAVNFSQEGIIDGSLRRMSGNDSRKEPSALFTANYSVPNGQTIECLVTIEWKIVWVDNKDSGQLEESPPHVEVCLVPIEGDRMVLALNDHIEASQELQLVMSVALEGVKTFRDLNVLRALPWMVGDNDGIHTYRELGVLAVLSHKMIKAIGRDGYSDVELTYGVERVTVPTIKVWGIVLFAAGLILMVGAGIIMNTLRKRLKIKGNLASARGIAEHWLWQQEDLRNVNNARGEVVLAADSWTSDGWTRVGVKREEKFNDEAKRDEGV
ncbi:hypothetical protein FGB62_61g02 [Gracilaria domingensis]|nr:hypothetical protein FGB62_61g02 [Gracilaria domingensis]